MQIKENVRLKPMTTMRIGGNARYFAELTSREDVEEAYKFSQEKQCPLIVLGSGSNTVFADGEINAVVVRIKHDRWFIEENRVKADAGAALASVVAGLAEAGLDLSALTGIPGTIGGAVFGNAGQGPKGIWLDSFIRSVIVFSGGKWQTLKKDECGFNYRESIFKRRSTGLRVSPIIWEVELEIPHGDPQAIKTNIETLLKKRIETQPHLRTAGSCFKATSGTPAWKLIEAAGLKDAAVGGVKISEKHANFLISSEGATYSDAKGIVELVKSKISEPLEVEMRFISGDGSVSY